MSNDREREAFDPRGSRRSRWLTAAESIAILLLVLAAVEVADHFLPTDLDGFGVEPRTLRGLRGIVLAPLLHAGLGHLLANAVPFLMLGFLILLRGWREFALVTMVSAIFSGGLAWLLGTNGTVHIGASGLVFGYFGFLIARGLFERSLSAAVVALVVGLCYGGLLWGLLPSQAGVSWEMHTGGLVGGALCGNWLARSRRNNNALE